MQMDKHVIAISFDSMRNYFCEAFEISEVCTEVRLKELSNI